MGLMFWAALIGSFLIARQFLAEPIIKTVSPVLGLQAYAYEGDY